MKSFYFSAFLTLATFAVGLEHLLSYNLLPVPVSPIPQLAAGDSVFFEFVSPPNGSMVRWLLTKYLDTSAMLVARLLSIGEMIPDFSLLPT